MAVSIWEGSKAQALVDAVANVQKIDKQQGSANAGKALVVGSDGLVGFGDAGVSDSVKIALLNCFAHVAWVDEYGPLYYDSLERALYSGGSHDPDMQTPITSLESLHRGGYIDNTGGITEQSSTYYPYNSTYSLEDYFPISPTKRLVWIRGKQPLKPKVDPQDATKMVPDGQFSVYRIAYYDKDKVFIRRDVSTGTSALDFDDPDYMEFVCPEDTAYIRISWNGTPYPGAVIYALPDTYYNVMIDLAKSDDATIQQTQITGTEVSGAYTFDVMSALSIHRNGTDVTPQYVEPIIPAWAFGVLNRSAQDMRDATKYNFNSTNRILPINSILLQKGDVITCSQKMHVRAERILDGKATCTSDWIVNGSFTVGVDGEEIVRE